MELFDFDNTEYGWFVSDIANALFAALWRIPDQGGWQPFVQRFLDRFLRGYGRHYTLPSEELNYLEDFLCLREILIYTVQRKQRDFAQLSEVQLAWQIARRARIESGLPIVRFSR